MSKSTITCDNCGKEMKRYPSEINKHNFCSVKCRSAWQERERTKVKCDYCGKEFTKIKDEINDLNFCSRECSAKWHRKERIKLTCDYCGKEFEKTESEIRNHNFCSLECANKWQSEQAHTEICDWCGKEFKIPPKEVKEHNFCCHEHYAKWLSENNRGENHPNYTQETVLCDYCGKPLKRPRWRLEKNKYHFCNRECYRKFLQDGLVLTHCQNCGKKILMSRYRYLKHENHFCSTKCSQEWHRGKNSESWKGGKRPYYYGPNWQQQREKVLKRDNYKCQVCGKAQNELDYSLEAHHINPVDNFIIDKNGDKRLSNNYDWEEANKMSNLITVCKSCHGKIEGKTLDEILGYTSEVK